MCALDDPDQYYQAQQANGAAFLQSVMGEAQSAAVVAADEQLPQPIDAPPFEGPDPADNICE